MQVLECRTCGSSAVKEVTNTGDEFVYRCDDCGEYFTYSPPSDGKRARRSVKTEVRPIDEILKDFTSAFSPEQDWTADTLLEELEKLTSATGEVAYRSEEMRKKVEAMTEEEIAQLKSSNLSPTSNEVGVKGIAEESDEDTADAKPVGSVGMLLTREDSAARQIPKHDEAPEMEVVDPSEGLHISEEELDKLVNQILFGEGE